MHAAGVVQPLRTIEPITALEYQQYAIRLARWLVTHSADDLPMKPHIATLPTAQKFEAPLRALEESVAAFLQHCHTVGSSRTANFHRLRQRPSEQPLSPAQKEELDIVMDASDFWDVSIVDSINYIKQGLNSQNLDPGLTYDTIMHAVSLISASNNGSMSVIKNYSIS